MRFGERTEIQWHNVYQDREGWDRLNPVAASFTRWVDTHLMRPNPELGRDGPVCPFIRGTTTRTLLWAGLAAGGDRLDESALLRITEDALDIYQGLRADHAYRAQQVALVTLFPGLTRVDRIDAVHAAQKTTVVRAGLMLGQFYPGCRVPGLWNHRFHPLDAPVPMLVLRPMMSTDFPFLAGREEWLYAYFTRLAPDVPRRLRVLIARKLLLDEAVTADITALRAHELDEHAR